MPPSLKEEEKSFKIQLLGVMLVTWMLPKGIVSQQVCYVKSC